MTRDVELAKYERAYQDSDYKMSKKRLVPSVEALAQAPSGSYLDLGCGRGEMLREAEALGFSPCIGVDPVPALKHLRARVTQLPFADASFDVVSLFDVIEHLPIGDEVLALREANRVARSAFVISANNLPSKLDGMDLHINIRSYAEWAQLIQECWNGEMALVHTGFSPIWLCTRAR